MRILDIVFAVDQRATSAERVLMNRFMLAFAMAVFGALTGCATGPVSTLPMIDVSKIENGKVLTAAEIIEVVRGKQLVGNIIRSGGNNVQDVTHVYEADGTLRGALPPRYWDVGTWSVNSNTDQLCWNWIRWFPDCAAVSVRGGKLHAVN